MKKILFVDDESMIVDTFSELLSEEFEVVIEQNPKNVKNILDDSFHLVISDFNMSGLSGVELSKEVKSKHNIPFIIFTGFCESEELVCDTIDYILQKPITIKNLKETIRKVL